MNPEQSVSEMLTNAGAVLLRNRKHEVWQLPNGKQFVRAKTPSDFRADANNASVLRRLLNDNNGPLRPPVAAEQPQKAEQSPTSKSVPTVAIRAGVRSITPKLAAEWLEKRNTHNRKLSEPIAQKYARDMSMGRWVLNGEPIILAADGSVMDGQHRLRGVVLSGQTVQMMVVDGVPRDTFSTIDVGKTRCFADVLHIDGYKNTNVLASAIIWMMRLRTDTVTAKRAFTQAESRDAFELDPGIVDSVRALTNTKQVKRLASLAMCAALHYEFSRHDSSMADVFFSALDSGEALSKTDPVYVLRERLVANSGSVSRLPHTVVCALFVKAWNATMSGSKVKRIHWAQEREGFPQIAAGQPK